MQSTESEEVFQSGDILTGLNGTPLSVEELSGFVMEDHPEQVFASCDVVPGTEKRWPQSHSAQLRLIPETPDRPARHIYLKKILAANLPAKSLASLRRDLVSNRNEARFYREFAPTLASRGLPLLKARVHERLDVLDATTEQLPHEQEASLRSGGVLFLLEYAEGYMQTSPLSAEQAACSLRLLARLHAAAWEDKELLRAAALRLHRPAGYWSLHQRGEEEMRQMRDIWPSYCSAFISHAPALFARPEICRLADRLEAVAPWVSEQLQASVDDCFATLMHGDYKAMNVFLPESGEVSQHALPIDFQWTGVGYGIAEVAMHLFHSVSPAALRDGGEVRLVEMYCQMLSEALAPADAASFTAPLAWRLYRLGLLDWARMVFSCFFKGASPEVFASKSDMQNVGMVYRNIEASLYFVERVHECLVCVEGELAQQKCDQERSG